MQREGKHRSTGSRIEAGIQTPISVEPGDTVTWLTTQGFEITTYDDLSIGLNCESDHAVVCPRIKAVIQTSVRVDPANTVSSLPIQCRKIPAHQNLPIGLQR
ncbi:hypothetical protein SDC9_173257 [bioreactor metagenome]|uniref:Uncharacterized protein n=1 Tax=bioreactor metagenome TaxID=1076179 RepID=A0A645GFX9_9ZZZZ